MKQYHFRCSFYFYSYAGCWTTLTTAISFACFSLRVTYLLKPQIFKSFNSRSLHHVNFFLSGDAGGFTLHFNSK